MFKKWFNQASQIDTLNRDLEFERKAKEQIEGLLEREETRNELLESAVKSERAKKDKVLLRHADMMSQKSGLTPAFVKDAESKKEPDNLIEYDDEMERRITAAAKLQQDIDPEPQSLEFYEESIRQDPERYLPH